MDASFVSRAKTAFHSAAAKAEKVLTDINKKPDPTVIHSGEDFDNSQSTPEDLNVDSETEEDREVKNSRWRPAPIKTKYDWHQKFKNIRMGKKGSEDSGNPENSPMEDAIAHEKELPQQKGSDNYAASEGLSDSNSEVIPPEAGLSDSNSDVIPPAASIKQLAVAIESGKLYKSINDIMVSSITSSPVRERASLSLSAMKSLVLREKQDKLVMEFGNNEKVFAVINSLLDTDGQCFGSKTGSVGVSANITCLPKEIHGAPPDSFLVKVAEATGSLKTVKKMASFWCRIVAEMNILWSEGKYIPGIPQDEIPDLNSCLLYQQLQLINCCISRKRRKTAATETLDYVLSQTSSDIEISSVLEDSVPTHSILYVKISTGEVVPRLGYDKPADNLTMLETGEPIYAPIIQEGPLLTEDLVKETEEFVLRTGSVGAGCSQLFSDMQAFKAANPGCILEDFVRWHSPPDWTENDTANEDSEATDVGDSLSSKGQLSCRMQTEGNLWRELWGTAKPVPAVKQTPLFDEDLAVEGVLHSFEDIKPSDLFEQLFLSLLGRGFVIADASLSTNSSLAKIFQECRNYILGTCNGNNWKEKVEDICQVYETLETMVLNPDEVVRITSQPEETPTGADLRNRFKRISLIFGSKDRNPGKTSPPSDQKNVDGNTMRGTLTAIFSKKPPKSSSASPYEIVWSAEENDWTLV